jgi:hypothetical protein
MCAKLNNHVEDSLSVHTVACKTGFPLCAATGNFISILGQGSRPHLTNSVKRWLLYLRPQLPCEAHNVYHLWCDDIFSLSFFLLCYCPFLCSEPTLKPKTLGGAAAAFARTTSLPPPSISHSHSASHPIDQRPNIWHSLPKSSRSTRQ